MKYYAGKNVLITGAASGLGRGMAERCGALGARLILLDIDGDGLDALAASPALAAATVHTFTCDLSDRHDVARVAAQVLAACAHVDVLINNAGIVSGRPLLELSDEQIESTFAINALALFWTTRAFLPHMLARDSGHIVTVASAAGIAGTARLTDYCASKFAAVGFDESLRLELRAAGSRVLTTVVCPFYTNTGMFSGASTRFPALLPILEPEYVIERVLRAVARGRRRVVLPRFVNAAFLMRLLPVALFDRAMAFFGISSSMDSFIGRRAEH